LFSSLLPSSNNIKNIFFGFYCYGDPKQEELKEERDSRSSNINKVQTCFDVLLAWFFLLREEEDEKRG
jgi:hypothetical protein